LRFIQRILAILSLLTILLSSAYFLIIQNIYGNGIRNNFGIDYLPPLNLDDTSLSLNVEFQPSMINSDINEKRSLIFKLTDVDKNITYIPNLYRITILKNDFNNGKITEKVFLKGSFFSINGTLILQFDSNKTNYMNNNLDKKISKYNIDKDYYNKVITSDENGIVSIDKLSLDSGIYRLKVNVSLSNATAAAAAAADVNNKDVILKFDSYLSLGNILDLEIDNNPDKELTILSFNDKILHYDYDQQSKKISFEIPFKYNMTRIEEGFIYIHVEIKIPNTFNEFFNAKEYLSTINSIDHSEISSASVSVDRYSNSSNITVHFILDSNSLFKLAKERQKYPAENSDMIIRFSLQPKY
jgi:hypothetical protein